jgi:acylpyruvate hydrolase
MQLLRYLGDEGAALGVLRGQRVYAVWKALQRHAERDGRLDALSGVLDAAVWEPKAFLALSGTLGPLLEEAIAADDGAAVVAEGGLDALRLLPFVPNPEKIIGLGYNLRALCQKEGVEEPLYPQIFAKLPTSVAGPRDEIEAPPAVDKVDFEAELCVVIGRTARRVGRAEALSYVGGYTVMDELSAKILPRPKLEAQTTTLALKGVDGFAPTGAVVVTPDEAGDPSELEIVCRVNGEERQRYPTSDFVHDVAGTIEYISSIITLHPGDLLSMGTSVGIGIVEVPPRLLGDGDVVECEVAGWPGCRNVIRIPAQRAAAR